MDVANIKNKGDADEKDFCQRFRLGEPTDKRDPFYGSTSDFSYVREDGTTGDGEYKKAKGQANQVRPWKYEHVFCDSHDGLYLVPACDVLRLKLGRRGHHQPFSFLVCALSRSEFAKECYRVEPTPEGVLRALRAADEKSKQDIEMRQTYEKHMKFWLQISEDEKKLCL